jgi:1-acyl-sn-glycerol-3-phosphate acyltransferase
VELQKKAKMIPVSRDGNDVRALLDCFKCLKNNEKVAIYPEGTRNKTGDILMDFKHGAAIIAIKTQTPVIPVMIYCKPRFFRCTHILIGEPIELTEYYGRKLTDSEYAEADEKLREYMLKMHAEHTAYLESKKKKKKDN